MKRFLFLIFFFHWFSLPAQQPADEVPEPPPDVKQYRHSVKLAAGLPLILFNAPFRKAMDGIYYVNGAVDFSLYKPIIAGVYYGYMMFDNADLKGNKGRRPDVTKGFFSIAGASIGYEKFIDHNKVITCSVNSGYSWIHYKRSVSFTDTVTSLLKKEALNLGITAGYKIVIEETGGIGFFISYRYLDYIFEPGKLMLIYQESRKKTHLLSLGVLFSFGF